MTLDPRSVIVGVAVALLAVGLVGWQQPPNQRQQLERQIAALKSEHDRLAREVPIVAAGAPAGGFVLVIDSRGSAFIVHEDGRAMPAPTNFRANPVLDAMTEALLKMPAETKP